MRRAKFLRIAGIALTLFALAACTSPSGSKSGVGGGSEKKVDVLCIYYPHWHVYPKGEEWFGKGWTEWEFVKTGKPRYKGHKLPYRPLTGYLDGKNPADVAKEIDLASNSGITVFVYDWYWYGGKRTMEESLEEGFLKAPNRDKMKFAIMWAYHDRADQFRPDPDKPRRRLMSLDTSPEDFKNALEYCIKKYFKEPNYYKINGRPYFMVYNSAKFVKDHGGPEKVKKLFSEVVETMRKNGLEPVYWSADAGSKAEAEMLAKAGFDGTTRYNVNPYHANLFDKKPDGLLCDYSTAVAAHERLWRAMSEAPLPNIPVVTMGWDSSMRCRNDVDFPWPKGAQYPYGPIYSNNNPDIFQSMLEKAKKFALSDPKSPGAILINAWNEYTEGSYLLPDIRDGDAYLRAIAAVFGRTPKNEYDYFDCATKKQCRIRAADFENVSYGEHYKNKLDVWLPKNAKGKTPAIIYFHGGGWTTGAIADRFIEASLENILGKGVAVVCANYRFIQDAKDADIFPPVAAPMEDCAKVVEFVKTNAAKWNIDPEKIAVSGGSAGACSALYVGLSPETAGGVAAIGVNIPQTSLDPKQMREWIPNITYGAHAFGMVSFDKWLSARDKLLPYIKKYSPEGLVAGAAERKSPKKIFLQNFVREKAGQVSKDPTHSPKFCERFKEICDAEKIDCRIVYGSAEKMFDELADFLVEIK
mgnify:FL=1